MYLRIAVCALPYLEDAWFHAADKYTFIQRWASAASRLRYTPEIGQSMVEVLLRMACMYQWRSHITWGTWGWLGRRPQLPPVCRARSLCCNNLGVISEVESLEDVEILRDYLIVVWSEWDWLAPWVCSHMCAVIKRHFGGERERGHRDKLRDRLLHIQKQHNLGLDHLRKLGSEMTAACFQPTKEAYEALMETLSEVESPSEVGTPSKMSVQLEVESPSESGSLQISRESTPDQDLDSSVSHLGPLGRGYSNHGTPYNPPVALPSDW